MSAPALANPRSGHLQIKYRRVFGRKPADRLWTNVVNLFAPGTYMVGHHLSTSSVTVQTNLAKLVVVASPLPTRPQILFELADMTISRDNGLALRKLSGPEPSPHSFDRNTEHLADPALTVTIGTQGNNLLVAFEAALAALLLPSFFSSLSVIPVPNWWICGRIGSQDQKVAGRAFAPPELFQ